MLDSVLGTRSGGLLSKTLKCMKGKRTSAKKMIVWPMANGQDFFSDKVQQKNTNLKFFFLQCLHTDNTVCHGLLKKKKKPSSQTDKGV